MDTPYALETDKTHVIKWMNPIQIPGADTIGVAARVRSPTSQSVASASTFLSSLSS